MKVSSQFSSSSIARGLIAVALALALSAVGASAPVAASAEEAVPSPAPTATPEASQTTTFSVPATFTIALAPTATVAPVAPAKKLTVRQIVAKVGRSKGLNKAEIDALLWLCKRESNFHPNSHSRTECHGLFQLSKGMAHGKPWRDPTWNTKRAIKYMRGRYGGVLQAKRFWIQHHWY